MRNLAISVALVIAVVAVYAQCTAHQFTRLDDPDYVVDNEHVNNGLSITNVRWAFTAIHASNWHPLTWISHMTDVQMFGLVAGKHLMTNIALHAANSVLLFFFLLGATRRTWPSAIVAALFALHPLHVESVAWVAERKDVLSTFFFLITLILWTRYVKSSSRASYWLSAFAFAAGLMSKPMLVTTPFVLLLLDWWPYRRAPRLIEKWPFFALVIGSILITLRAQQTAMGSSPMGYRITNAITAYTMYLANTFWPRNLAVIYPLPEHFPPALVIASFVIIGSITALAIRFRDRFPFVTTGWLWYLGTLVPVIGLVQVGHASRADRYTYIPLIGIFIAIVWLFEKRKAALLAAVPILIALGIAAHSQVKYWHDGVTLFEHALDVADIKDDRHIREGLGMELLRANEHARAAEHLRIAAEKAPREDGIRAALGTALLNLGDAASAKRELELAVSINPNNATALRYLGDISLGEGRPDLATEFYGRSAAAKPEPSTLAVLAAARGDFDEAIKRYREAIEKDPRNAAIHTDLAAVLGRSGKNADAIIEYEEALRLDPNAYEARMSYGALLISMGRNDEAIVQMQNAATARPSNPEPHIYMALVYERLKRYEDAIREATTAGSIDAPAANRILTNAMRIPFSEGNLAGWIDYVRQKRDGSGAQGRN
jgi:protein O-mannosyl-transferase